MISKIYGTKKIKRECQIWVFPFFVLYQGKTGVAENHRVGKNK
jgi:hypothetical protein